MTNRMWTAPNTPTRRALLVAGVATVGLSLILSIGTTFAKANSGTVMIIDASTGTAANGNDPTVCAFWVSFSDPTATDNGTWQLLNWDDKTVVDSGSYDTSGDGTDVTGTLRPDAGHYRFEWQAAGASNTKNKMLTVAADCADPAPVVTPTPTPVLTPTPTPVVTPTPTPVVTPTPTPVVTPTPTPVVTPTPTPVVTPTPTPTPSGPPSTAPSADPTVAPSATPTSQPEQEVLGTTSGGGSDTLADTRMDDGIPGLLGALGVLLIVAAHANTRRSKLPNGA